MMDHPTRKTHLDTRNSHLCAQIKRALEEGGYDSLRQVRPSPGDGHYGHVILHGRVPTYYAKQLAQVIALTVAGVSSLKNELVVEPPRRTDPSHGPLFSAVNQSL